jgi:ATP adenylyltransferase
VDRIWAGWRSSYIESTGEEPHKDAGCVFCELFASDRPAADTHIVWRSDLAVAILNAFPYTSGHVLVMPARHLAELGDLTADEQAALWPAVHDAVEAVTAAYHPDGVNLGANLGRAAGAGVPGHLHVHVVPRWAGDTNFMTTVAEARVLPEPIDVTFDKLSRAWPSS